MSLFFHDCVPHYKVICGIWSYALNFPAINPHSHCCLKALDICGIRYLLLTNGTETGTGSKNWGSVPKTVSQASIGQMLMSWLSGPLAHLVLSSLVEVCIFFWQLMVTALKESDINFVLKLEVHSSFFNNDSHLLNKIQPFIWKNELPCALIITKWGYLIDIVYVSYSLKLHNNRIE